MIKKSILLLMGLLLTTTVWATAAPILVIDAVNQLGLPNNFRTASDALPTGVTVNTQGLANLHAMGSAQFSEDGLVAVIDKIQAPIIVVDLRQESHGFMDGNAISWYATRDWANLGKTPGQVEAVQQKLLDGLAQKETVTLNKITDRNNEGQVTRVAPTVFDVDNVMSEFALTKLHQVGYTRIYVTDRLAPTTPQVDRFVQLVRSVPASTWLYFHCRAGKGRTTTFMVLYDMMRNAKQVSFEDILQRQHLLGGLYLGKLPEQTSYKYTLNVQRLEFLKNFYQYCRTNQDNFATSWSEWKTVNHIVSKEDIKMPVNISEN